MTRATFILAIGATLTGCGPMSPERAADFCENRARAAAGPTGSVHIGVDSHGHTRSGLAIGVSTDFLRGADPRVVYEDCVRQKSGQGPIRPLVL